MYVAISADFPIVLWYQNVADRSFALEMIFSLFILYLACYPFRLVSAQMVLDTRLDLIKKELLLVDIRIVTVCANEHSVFMCNFIRQF